MNHFKTSHTTIYEFYVRDVLKKPVDMGGFDLDATVSVKLYRIGREGKIELDSMTVGDIYLVIADESGTTVKLDQTHLNERNRPLVERFEQACLELAITRAREALDNQWDETSYLDGDV